MNNEKIKIKLESNTGNFDDVIFDILLENSDSGYDRDVIVDCLIKKLSENNLGIEEEICDYVRKIIIDEVESNIKNIKYTDEEQKKIKIEREVRNVISNVDKLTDNREMIENLQFFSTENEMENESAICNIKRDEIKSKVKSNMGNIADESIESISKALTVAMLESDYYNELQKYFNDVREEDKDDNKFEDAESKLNKIKEDETYIFEKVSEVITKKTVKSFIDDEDELDYYIEKSSPDKEEELLANLGDIKISKNDVCEYLRNNKFFKELVDRNKIYIKEDDIFNFFVSNISEEKVEVKTEDDVADEKAKMKKYREMLKKAKEKSSINKSTEEIQDNAPRI